MDSVNSGSHQSSSEGNDEPYDSRAAEDSLFMHSHPSLISSYNIINSSFTTTHQSSADHHLVIAHAHQSSSSQPPPSSAAASPTAARNPKKRSRASRRAPTTVLTTDTSNFRAMVQEFTGVPSTPFSSNSNNSSNIIGAAASFSGRARLDHLFRSSAGLDPSLPTPPSAHVRRPFPQKFQPTVTNPNLLNDPSDNIYYQQASDLYNAAANPFLSSLLQTATANKFTIPRPPTDINDHDSTNRVIGIMDGFDQVFNSGHVGKLTTSHDYTSMATTSLSSADQAGAFGNNNGEKAGGDSAARDADDLVAPPAKMAKYSGGGEKGLENVSTIESWICSTDHN